MSFVSLYLYVPDEGSLLPKYRDCTTSNDFESYIYIYMCVYMCVCIYAYIFNFVSNQIKFSTLFSNILDRIYLYL